MSGWARMQIRCSCPLTQPCRCGDEHTIVPVKNKYGELSGWWVTHDSTNDSTQEYDTEGACD